MIECSDCLMHYGMMVYWYNVNVRIMSFYELDAVEFKAAEVVVAVVAALAMAVVNVHSSHEGMHYQSLESRGQLRW